MGSNTFSRRNFIQKGTLASIAATTMIGSNYCHSNNMSLMDSEDVVKFN